VSFIDADPTGNLSQYSGTINWGDGTTSGGSFTTNAGSFIFGGTHIYAGHGTFSITVTVHDVGGASASATTSLLIP
jgi:hypothetical protein